MLIIIVCAMQAESPKTICATIVVGSAKKSGDADSLMNRIVTAVYDKCRADPACGLIPDFPDFAPLLAQMSETQVGATPNADFQVTVLQHDGALVIKEQFFQQFGEGDSEISEFHEIVRKHNEQFNESNLRLSTAAASAPVVERRTETCAVVETSEPLTAEKLANMNLSRPQPKSSLGISYLQTISMPH